MLVVEWRTMAEIISIWADRGPYIAITLNGERVGSISWEYWESLETSPRGRRWCEDHFDYYLNQLPMGKRFPMGYLNEIEVNSAMRGQGIGSAALQKWLQMAREHGCLTAFLNVGHDNDVEHEANVRWYTGRGFILLENPGPWYSTHMCRALEKVDAPLLSSVDFEYVGFSQDPDLRGTVSGISDPMLE